MRWQKLSEYVSIIAAKQAEKGGDIIAKVIAVSDIKEGKGDKGTWRMQVATLKDNFDEVKLTMWGDDVGGLDQGQIYKFEGLWWKDYKEELTPSIGKYTKLHLATPEDLIPNTEGEKPQESKPAESPEDRVASAIPDMEASTKQIVQSKALQLLQIEKHVREEIAEKSPREANNGQKIGMYTHIIFDFLNGKGVE